jgi:hypothetical protein
MFEVRKKKFRREILAFIDFVKARSIRNEHGVEGVGACFIPLGKGKTSFSHDGRSMHLDTEERM